MGSSSPSRSLLLASTLLGSLLAAPSARATYSIIALDAATGQVGGAGTSCVGSASVYAIYGVVPGTGVVAAQAALNTQARDRAVMLLEQGMSAADVIADISREDFDPFASLRQYAVIDVAGAAAVGFTGAATMAFADDVQGSVPPYVYSVQGNILTSAAVLTQARAIFMAPGCDLADTLLLALEAGAENDEGDSRCTPDGIPSDGAFIEVNLPNQETSEPFLHLEVSDTSPSDPLTELRALYDAWRAAHPCPEPPSIADAGAPNDAGMTLDAGTQEEEPDPPATGGSVAPATGGSGGLGASGVGGMVVAGGGAIGGVAPTPEQPAPQATPQSSSGCAIAQSKRSTFYSTCLLIVAGALRRRRRLTSPASGTSMPT